MECVVRWAGPETMSFIAETGSGHSFVMDGAPEGGGRDLAPRPMEALLAGAAACTAYDVVLILRKSGQDVHRCEVEARAIRAETDPKVFTEINLIFKVRGKDLKASLVERAIELSRSKYCSAIGMLRMSAVINTGYQVRP